MFMILFNLIDRDVKVIDKIQTYTKLTKYQETAVAPDITKKIDCSCTEQIQLISSESIQSRNSRNRNNSQFSANIFQIFMKMLLIIYTH